MKTFTTGQMQRLASVPLDTVQDWARRQHIVPVGTPTPGKGKVRLYPPQAAFAVCVGGMLQRAGVHGESIAKAVRFCGLANVQQRLEAGQRFLCVTNGTLTVLTADGVNALVQADGEPGAWALVDLAKLHRRFVTVALGARTPAELRPLIERPMEVFA